MNESMQKSINWHPLGIQGQTLQGGLVIVCRQTAAPPRTFLTIDQSESYGFRRDARVINL
ncbi:hypothetical protein [Candidatus Leptofilum sp.]|uniref:hypothetical protein n=1 Tax=Candidatus Leptofilum sp. TaxID=3241576 RepID=UPI003B59BD6C